MEEVDVNAEKPSVQPEPAAAAIEEVEIAELSAEVDKKQAPQEEQPGNEEGAAAESNFRRSKRRVKRKNLHLSHLKNRQKRQKLIQSCVCKPGETKDEKMMDVSNDFEEYVEEETAVAAAEENENDANDPKSNVIELEGGKKIYIIKPAAINKKVTDSIKKCPVHLPPVVENTQPVISREDEYTKKISDALYYWFEKVVENGIQLTHKEILDKLYEIHKGAGAKIFWPYFKPDEDWLAKWKTIYDARRPIVTLKIRRINDPLAKKYVKWMENKVKEDKYHIKQVFCAQKIFVDFKTLPRKNKSERLQYRPSGVGRDCDRLTIMVCTNVDGSLKLPLLVIGRSSSKDILKNIPQHLLPVSYVYHRSNWLNDRIFKLWLKNEFAPRVSKFLKANFLPAKAFIIMEDYKPKGKLSTNNLLDEVEVERMDPFITPILHPMEQGILQHIKTNFKLGFLKTVIYAQTSGADLDEFLKSISMRQVIFRLKDTWDSVAPQTIAKSWSKLLPSYFDDQVDKTPNKIISVKEMKTYIQKIKDFQAVEDKSVQEWIDSFEDAPLFIPATKSLVDMVNKDVIPQDTNVEEDKEFYIPDIVDAANTLLKFYEENSFLSGAELAVIRKAKQIVIDLAITKDASVIKKYRNNKK